MAITLRSSTVLDLVNAIVPLYACIVLGFASSKLRILPHVVTYAGLQGFASKFAVPITVFKMVAVSNPYQIDLRLIGADTIFKIFVLLALSINCCYRPTAEYVAWVSVLFNLATINNLILIGTPLLTALYPGTDGDVASLIFMQGFVWFSVITLLLEIHKAVHENSKEVEENGWGDPKGEIQGKHGVGADKLHGDEETNTAGHTKPDDAVRDPQQDHDSTQHSGVADGLVIRIPQDGATESEGPSQSYGQVGVVEPLAKVKPTKVQVAMKIMQTVLYQFFWAPLVWGSIMGFIYGLINFKFNHGKAMPRSLSGSVELINGGTLGICMFMLGMNMGVTKKWFAGGVPMALFGAGLRFIIAPAFMAAISFVVGLRGTMFRFSVMQAMVPQAILSFFFHSTYDVHVDVFSTAVWFQTATFLPFALALNLLLNLRSSHG